MKSKNLMLSVVIISYKQENYISDAIESVLKQKTNYNYEILLADDCSPDNTGKIAKEYAKKYPDKIRVLPRPKNMGVTANSFDACCNAKGKYICILEGDDFWSDEFKIEKQVKFLEEHEDYVAVSHLQTKIDSITKEKLGVTPTWIKKDCEVTIDDFLREKHFSETAAIFRNIYKDEIHRKNMQYLSSINANVGDLQKCLYLLSLGRVWVFNSEMMCYRYANNSNNYNSRFSIDEICLQHLDIMHKLDDFFDGKYNFLPKYKRYFTIGTSYSIINFRLKKIRNLLLSVPKKHRFKVVICYPVQAIKILIQRVKGR